MPRSNVSKKDIHILHSDAAKLVGITKKIFDLNENGALNFAKFVYNQFYAKNNDHLTLAALAMELYDYAFKVGIITAEYTRPDQAGKTTNLSSLLYHDLKKVVSDSICSFDFKEYFHTEQDKYGTKFLLKSTPDKLAWQKDEEDREHIFNILKQESKPEVLDENNFYRVSIINRQRKRKKTEHPAEATGNSNNTLESNQIEQTVKLPKNKEEKNISQKVNGFLANREIFYLRKKIDLEQDLGSSTDDSDDSIENMPKNSINLTVQTLSEDAKRISVKNLLNN